MQQHTSYPEYRFSDLIAENPFRFLEYCDERQLTPTVIGLLRGMCSRERLIHWARAEHERYGNRPAVAKAVGTRLAHVFEYDAEADLDATLTPTTHTRGRPSETPASTEAPTPESTPETDAHHADFEQRVSDSYSIISSIDDEPKLVDILDDEIGGESRKHVIAAINRRLAEVRSAPDATDDESTTTDTATA